MLRFFFMFLASLFVLHGQEVMLVVKNETGRDFEELYVFSQEEQEKEKNVLSQQACLVWEDGRSITIPLKGGAPWTIRGVDSDGDEVVWRNIYASSELVLKLFAGQPEALNRDP